MDEKQGTEMAKKQTGKPKTQEKPQASKKTASENDNVVFIGAKPFLNYVNSVLMQFNTKDNDSVVIKARGKFITRAVDVAEIVKRRYLKDGSIEVKDIKIGSDEFENNEGKKVNVSIIEITLNKK